MASLEGVTIEWLDNIAFETEIIRHKILIDTVPEACDAVYKKTMDLKSEKRVIEK